jgi:hypothetical protein
MSSFSDSDGLLNLEQLADQLETLPQDKSVPIVFGKCPNNNYSLHSLRHTQKFQDLLDGGHHCLVLSIIGVALTMFLER